MGEILGTAAYMAPEQARGKTVDKRADIWAFGVVLYEMLTGRRLFEGETISDTLAAVLTKEPEWERVPAEGAPRLLRSCLEKDPKRRLRDIGDGALEIAEAIGGAARRRRQGPLQTADLRHKFRGQSRERWHWLSPSRCGRLGAARGAPGTTQPRCGWTSISVLMYRLAPAIGPAVILSPDGTRLVFVSQGQDGTRRLFTRRLDQPKAVRLSGTEGAYAPFFSPDGQWVGFFAEGKLKKTRIDGGEPVSLCDAPAGRGGSWGEDGNIIAALDPQAGLSQVPPEGGKADLRYGVGSGEGRYPSLAAGLAGRQGRAVHVSTEYGYYDEAGIAVVSLKDHRRKTVLEHAGMYPRYLPSGHLVYVTKGTLFAVPFDLDRLEVRGAATLLEEVSSNPHVGFCSDRLLAKRNTRVPDWRDRRAEDHSMAGWRGKNGIPRYRAGLLPCTPFVARRQPAGIRR